MPLVVGCAQFAEEYAKAAARNRPSSTTYCTEYTYTTVCKTYDHSK